MGKSSTPIIEHIPRFLDYCKEVGLSVKTYENYKHYLNKFILWLKKENKTPLLPHKLTPEDIQDYKLYLSRYTDKKGHPLKRITQNYYLIALRALLSYFTAKDIVSPPATRITLPRGFRAEKSVKFLNLEQIEKLSLAPDTRTPIGLRDRAILETLISTGLKINRLTKLNRDQLDNMSGEVLPWVEKYLKIRKDKNSALFINFNARKSSIGGRLTARSIERIVRHYGKKTNLPFSITPEILRRARAHALINKKIQIQRPQTHKTFIVKNYRNIISNNREKKQYLSSPWHVVEDIINQEISWLKGNVPVLPESYKVNPPLLRCDDCILRKIAILIVSGKVKAFEINSENKSDLWNVFTKNSDLKELSRHGKEWHRRIMDIINEYFKSKGNTVVLEPILDYGRADLGVFLNPNTPIYIEVGTVSLFKLWYNLSTMQNAILLVVPFENSVIEFRV